MKETLPLFGVLFRSPQAVGLDTTLSKIVVTADYKHFGLIFWQFVIAALLLGALLLLKDKFTHTSKV